jgi:SpoIID/LytB domain protein
VRNVRRQFALCRRAFLAAATTATVVVGVAALQLSGAPDAGAWPTANVTITGHGYGHGRGMGQYGAYGYALKGWTYQSIISHYYGGTTLGTRANGTIKVELSALAGGSLAVMSGKPFTAGGVAISAGRAVKLTHLSTGKFQLAISPGCGKAATSTRTVSAALVQSSVASPGSTLANMLTVCNGHRTYRGTLSLVYSNGTHVVNALPMESYLRGVVPRESPASWGDSAGGKGIAALQSQAVAARSYTWAQNRYSYARICDNQNCQVYGGAGLNGQLIEDSRTDKAVSTTAGRVLTKSGAPVSAEYSSSTGGWTAGGNFPAVVDDGDSVSPYHNWSASPSASSVGHAFGVGTLSSITVLSRTGLGADGGRVLSVRVTGSARSVTISGAGFANTLGLRSDWFSVGQVQPYTYLTNSPTGASTAASLPFGKIGDQPLTCDWNGDGTDTPAIYRAGVYYIRNTLSTTATATVVTIGRAGDVPVCGDWNGDGTDTVGVYRPSTATFYLSNSVTGGGTRIQLVLGRPGDAPLAGDWNGDHHATVGVYRPSTATFYLVDSNVTSAVQHIYQRGVVGDRPVAGDWDGDGHDSIGVFHSNHTFALMNQPDGAVSIRVDYGHAGDVPLAGDWNHDGIDTVGVGRNYRR